MKHWLSILLKTLMVLLLAKSTLMSQAYQYLNFTKNDGLPTNYVYGVIQDENGYIYAYTDSGLAKYDGYEWHHLTTQDGLPGMDVHTMLKDKDGILHGQCYNGKSFRIVEDTIYNNQINSSSLLSYYGKALYSASNYKSYLISKNGDVDSINLSSTINTTSTNSKIANQKLKRYVWLLSEPIRLIYLENSNLKMFNAENGKEKLLLSFKSDNYNQILVRNFNKDRYSLCSVSWALFFDSTLNITDTINYSEHKIFDDYIILNTFKDRDENLWIGTKNKGILHIPKSHRMSTIVKGTHEEYISSILKIDETSILFTTDKGKLFYKNGMNINMLEDYRFRMNQLDHLDDNRVIISSDDSLHIWNISNTPRIENNFRIKIRNQLENLPNDSTALSHAKNIFYDKTNQMYFASTNSSLMKTEGNFNNTFTTI